MRCFVLPLLVSCMTASLPASSASADVGLRTDHLDSRLVAESMAAVPGQKLRIGLLLQHDPHWHTYWRNPGDSGLPTRIELQLPDRVVASDIQWPAPQRFDIEGIVNFGYGGEQLLPIELQVPEDFADAQLEIVATASWLICEIECIPGRGEYRLNLPVEPATESDPRWRASFERSAARQPRLLDATAHVRRADDRIEVEVEGSDLPPDIAAWEMFPVQQQVLVNGAYPMLRRLDPGMRMSFPASESFAGLPQQLDLVLVKEDQALTLRARTSGATSAQ